VSPADVARAYFEAIRARDGKALRGLFAPDAELVTPAGTVRGAEAIAAFYEASAFQAADLEPRPGPFLVSGGRVACEIELRLAGTSTAVADFFTIEAEHIVRLSVFLGPQSPV